MLKEKKPLSKICEYECKAAGSSGLIKSRYNFKTSSAVAFPADFSFNLFSDGQKFFHDRIILTNYFIISCGAGFDLFNRNGCATHTTTVQFIYPFIQRYIKWAVDNYCNQLDTARELVDTAVNNNFIQQYWGETKDNRLLLLR